MRPPPTSELTECVVAHSVEHMVRRFPRRPGMGWKAYEAAPVWEHVSGIRVHSLGSCRLADGTIINGEHWPECLNLCGPSANRARLGEGDSWCGHWPFRRTI